MQVQGVYMTDAAAFLVRTLPGWGWTGLQHLALGFELVGTYRRVGFKFDTWHDVAWTQLMLEPG